RGALLLVAGRPADRQRRRRGRHVLEHGERLGSGTAPLVPDGNGDARLTAVVQRGGVVGDRAGLVLQGTLASGQIAGLVRAHPHRGVRGRVVVAQLAENPPGETGAVRVRRLGRGAATERAVRALL